MSSKPQIATEIEELKKDASRVLADMVKISSYIGARDTIPASEESGLEPEHLREKIESMRATAKTIKEEITKRAEKADKHVKANPYLFLALAGGIGFALGKLRAHRRES
jgi:ElaB/YqjD/DUF883 family membrane-anchored ribosome-binding protein